MRKPLARYSAGGYEDRFGTWRGALEKFVTYVNVNSEAQPFTMTLFVPTFYYNDNGTYPLRAAIGWTFKPTVK